MADNPWDQFQRAPASSGVTTIPGTGRAPPAGFQPAPGGLAPISGGPQDPAIAARIAGAEAAARAGAQLPATMAEIQARQQAAIQQAAIIAEMERGRGPALTAKERADALDRFKASDRIANRVRDLQALYSTGPGSTSGFSGLQDYLPSTANKRFDAAGQALRGDIGAALGFTGGQLNSVAEAQLNIGAYIPEAGDRDEVIQDKLARLQELVDSTRSGATTILGGTPDARGRIMPVAPAVSAPPPQAPLPPQGGGQLPPGQIPPSGPAGGPQVGFNPSGGFTAEPDPLRAGIGSRVSQMLSSGVPDEEVAAYATSVGASPASIAKALEFRRKNPTYRGGYDASGLEVSFRPIGAIQNAMNSAAQSPLGTAAIMAGDSATFGTLDNMTANPAQTRAAMRGLQLQNPNAALAGTVGGGFATAIGGEMALARLAGRLPVGQAIAASPRTADALYGAATGAGNADESSRLEGALVGGGAGMIGGMFGRGIGRTAGRVARGVRNPDVDYLRQNGVTDLTVGQVLGGRAKSIEDAMTSVPLAGDSVNATRLGGLRQFNQAAFAQGAAPINRMSNTIAPVGTNGLEGAPAIDMLRQARSDAYRRTLDPVNVTADAPYIANTQQTLAAGQALPDPMRGNADYTLNTRVGQAFDNSGNLSGNDFQQAIRGLRRDERAMAPQPYGNDFANVTRQAEGDLEGLLQRQAPGALGDYRLANEANRNIEVLRDVVNRSRNGGRSGEVEVFTPSQLADSAAANARRFGNSQGTTNQPFYELSRAGQRVLPSSLPDSGTARRVAQLAAGSTAAGGLGGGVGFASGGDASSAATGTGAGIGGALGVVGALALGGSRPAQALATRALLSRPDALIRIGNQIYNRANLLGPVGAPLGLTAANSFSGR